MGVFFNPFITWSGHNYHIDKNLMYKTKPMGASSSFILHTAKHVFIDHMLSYALWQLGAQPYLSFHHHLCCLHSAGRQVSSCLPTPSLCFLSSPRPAHCTPHTHSHFLCKSLWTLISKELLLFAQLLSLSFLSTIFDRSHLMSVPYFLKRDYKTTIVFPYNTCIMTPYEFLPATLEGKKHARCLFSGSVRANVPVLDRSTWGSEHRNNTLLLSHYAFSLHCFAKRHKRHKAWKENMQRRKNKNPEGCSGGEGREKRNRKLTRRCNKMKSKSLPNSCQHWRHFFRSFIPFSGQWLSLCSQNNITAPSPH